MDILDFLPALQMKLKLFPSKLFSCVDGMLLKHSFYFYVLYEETICDVQKMRQTLSESARLRNDNEWNTTDIRSESLEYYMYYLCNVLISNFK